MEEPVPGLARTQNGLADTSGRAPHPRPGAGERRHVYMVPPREGSTVGRALREDRLARGWTQQYVADAIGIQQSKLSAFERGAIQFPDPRRLIALAELFGHPSNHFTDMAGWPSAAQLLDQLPPPDALVVTDPLLKELIEAARDLDDRQLASIIRDVRFEAQHGATPPVESRETA